MTSISLGDLSRLADLSGLDFTDQELESLMGDLEKIIGYFNELNELDTTDVEPTYQVADLENIWREDVVEPSAVTRERLLDLAPDQLDSQIKVPKVL